MLKSCSSSDRDQLGIFKIAIMAQVWKCDLGELVRTSSHHDLADQCLECPPIPASFLAESDWSTWHPVFVAHPIISYPRVVHHRTRGVDASVSFMEIARGSCLETRLSCPCGKVSLTTYFQSTSLVFHCSSLLFWRTLNASFTGSDYLHWAALAMRDSKLPLSR